MCDRVSFLYCAKLLCAFYIVDKTERVTARYKMYHET